MKSRIGLLALGIVSLPVTSTAGVQNQGLRRIVRIVSAENGSTQVWFSGSNFAPVGAACSPSPAVRFDHTTNTGKAWLALLAAAFLAGKQVNPIIDDTACVIGFGTNEPLMRWFEVQ